MSAVGSILTNTGALDALQGISASNASNNTLESELSSGMSINSPASNPAGYITAQGFTSQLNGITQAISNANEGVSLMQTAQGALSQQIGIVQSLNSISVQAANGTQTPEESQSLQSVASQLVQQVDTIAKTTQFNNINLLDGSFQGVQIQDGANEGQNLNLTIGNTQANNLGMNASTVGSIYNAATLNASSASAALTTGAAGAANGAFSVTTPKVTWTGANGNTGSTTLTGQSESAATIAAAVNATTGNTGVQAQATTQITLNTNNGGSGFAFTLQSSAGSGTKASTAQTINAANVTQLVSQINGNTGVSGITATLGNNNQITLTQANGENIAITNYTSTSGSLTTTGSSHQAIKAGSANAVIQGQVQFQSSAGFSLGNGANIGLSSSSTLTSLDDIDVTTTSGANTAINVVKFALDALNKQGGQLGATQQALTANIANLNTTSQNVTTALGTVQDANIPQVSQQLTEAQIQAQAGVAALKASTQIQQSYTSLLP